MVCYPRPIKTEAHYVLPLTLVLQLHASSKTLERRTANTTAVEDLIHTTCPKPLSLSRGRLLAPRVACCSILFTPTQLQICILQIIVGVQVSVEIVK